MISESLNLSTRALRPWPLVTKPSATKILSASRTETCATPNCRAQRFSMIFSPEASCPLRIASRSWSATFCLSNRCFTEGKCRPDCAFGKPEILACSDIQVVRDDAITVLDAAQCLHWAPPTGVSSQLAEPKLRQSISQKIIFAPNCNWRAKVPSRALVTLPKLPEFDIS